MEEIKIKKIIKLAGYTLFVSLLSMAAQHKLNIAYKIVYFENLYLHKEGYKVDMKLAKVNIEEEFPNNIYSVDFRSVIEFVVKSEYVLEILIPEEYRILNSHLNPKASSEYPRYTIISEILNKKRYRNLEKDLELLLFPSKKDIPEKTIKVLFRLDNELKHTHEQYSIKTENWVASLSKPSWRDSTLAGINTPE